MKALIAEVTANRLIGGVEWTGALLRDEEGAYWMGVHTSTGSESWDSEAARLDATSQEEAMTEVRTKLTALIKACVGVSA